MAVAGDRLWARQRAPEAAPRARAALAAGREIWGQREASGQRPPREASLDLWRGQSWATVPVWAVGHIWAIPIWAVVHIWAVVALRAVVAGGRKPLPPPRSSGSSQGEDDGRLSTA